MLPKAGEALLQLLQRFIKHKNQVYQIHALLITYGHLIHYPNPQQHCSKWKTTLFYNTLIRAHLNFGQNLSLVPQLESYYKTLYLFTLMLKNKTSPNSHTFPPLIKASTLSCPLTGYSLHAHVIKRGVLYDPFVQTSLFRFYAQIAQLFDAHKMFDEITVPGIVEYNAMVDAYAKNGDMGSSCFLFKSMSERDVISWTSVINGFLMNGHFSDAIELFREMMVSDDAKCGFVKPNEATFVSVLSSCANFEKHGALRLGKQIHGYIVKNENILSAFVATALIDLYGKIGCFGNAIEVFNQTVVKKVCTWNALISSMANNGREKEAVDMFEKMKEEGFCPNEITFVALLTACARARLVNYGFELFQSMNEFGVAPIMEHYGCMVDLLGRAGLLREANDFVKSMPFEPDASVLGALLGTCKIHGEIELGNDIGKRLLEMQPHHSGRYVILYNINAGAEKWRQAAEVRKAMAVAGIRKVPAYSWTDAT